jgi:transitional endoplasmic reticulum ATPase
METTESLKQENACSEESPVIRMWVLRLVSVYRGSGKLGSFTAFLDEDAETLLDACGLMSKAMQSSNPRVVSAGLRRLRKAAEDEGRSALLPQTLLTNAQCRAKLVGLTDTDCRLLEFSVMMFEDSRFRAICDGMGSHNTTQLYQLLATVLDLPESDVRQSLSGQSALIRSGLLSVERIGRDRLSSKLELLSTDFADNMMSGDAEPKDLIRETVSVAGAAHLTVADYDHTPKVLSILLPYLRHSIDHATGGVNVLVYGEPGTGKSQLARLMAQELGCDLFEVACQDSEGDPVGSTVRLRAYRMAQSFFGKRRALILFDEVEDVFEDAETGFRNKSTARSRKAWMNRTLEGNAIPTLWLSNSVSEMDPAFIRRFDLVLELPVPSRAKREKMVEAMCAGLADNATKKCLVASDDLAPAVLARASQVVRSVHETDAKLDTSRTLQFLVNNTLRAQGHKALPKGDAAGLPEVYDPAFINADCNLNEVARGLVASRSGRLCLFGPPGTGKTAYAKWLAQQMGAPLMVRRASDLISKWVGDSEKNVAIAFRQAAEEEAVLLLDEVDSFLQDRRSTAHHWEVSLVNEMLTQMEAFDGVFIASTNLMRDLDQAALRRFDLKVRFDYLGAEQAWLLLTRHCAEMQLQAPEVGLRVRLDALHNLTPGDYAAVARQHRFKTMRHPAAFVDALELEASLKEVSGRSIGFVH